MSNVFFIFIGGGTGSVLRYLISRSMSSNFTHIHPYAILSSNLLASLLLAYLMYYTQERDTMFIGWKLVTLTALCGGFSTFSTFSYETYELFRLNMPFYAILNILISVGLGIFIMFLLSKFA